MSYKLLSYRDGRNARAGMLVGSAETLGGIAEMLAGCSFMG